VWPPNLADLGARLVVGFCPLAMLKALLRLLRLALFTVALGETPVGRSDEAKMIRLEPQEESIREGHTSIRSTLRQANLVDDASLLDVEDDTGFRMRDYGVQIYERPAVWGHPHLGSLLVYHVKERTEEPCGMLIAKVIYAIKYAMAKKHRNHEFVTEPEAELYTELEDEEDGSDVLTNTMRVLGNYSLGEGIQAGSVWKIDDQNSYISCEQNIQAHLEEHTVNFNGDGIYQGDMASVGSHCVFGEQNKKRGTEGFAVGTADCQGYANCQFTHPEEAVHFCNHQPDCIAIEGRIDPAGCEGGFGCYVPKKGELKADPKWATVYGGKTYIKHCPGALTELENAVKSGRRQAGDLWAGGQIAYCFTEEVSDVAQEAVHIAVQDIMRQVPCLHLSYTSRANSTACKIIPSIIFTSDSGGGCWSYVGQVSGKTEGYEHKSQALNIDRGCELPGIVLHELGHALGMVHQQARADRDEHVKLYWDNISSGKSLQFKKSNDAEKWAFSGFDNCDGRVGVAKLLIDAQECLDVQGYRVCSSRNRCYCKVDLCESGLYKYAPPNSCKEKVATGAMMMKLKDCATAEGVVVKEEKPDRSWQKRRRRPEPEEKEPGPNDWIKCQFDICKDTGYSWARPYSCNNRIGAAYFDVRKADCVDMGAAMNLGSRDVTNYIDCHLDICSGEVDTPFDWTSLMMYSPYQFSKANHSGGPHNLTMEAKGHRRLMDVVGQRMSLSSMDVFHLGHMYGCHETIKPDMNLSVARAIIDKMNTGQFFEYEKRMGAGKKRVCEDVNPEHTGFDIQSDAGFLKHASCDDLKQYCHNGTIGQQIRSACPVSCFVCMPGSGVGEEGVGLNGPCFDASQTGIRFRDGPKATCPDLINYCNNSLIGPQVTTACPMSCGQCEIHVEGPYLDQYGNCADLPSHEEPQFTVSGNMAGCADIKLFCQNHPDAYLVRHKCPETCGVCGKYSPPPPPAPATQEVALPGDSGGCDRRRRYGFCSTRRRRNI